VLAAADTHFWIAMVSIPLFTGAIGYVTNWSGIWMLFNPLRFAGVRIPLLGTLVQTLAPRRIQEIPGLLHGGIGWQGIIPSRAARMGSIAVDKGIAKLGSPADFYQQLEPEKIAAHILETSRADIRGLVERIMEREHPGLWRDTPPRVKEAIHARVQQQLPDIVRDVTDQIGENIDQLLDVKLMVIKHIEAEPQLANRIFQEIGASELKFVINFGFWFGLVLGIPTAIVTELVLTQWFWLPLFGVAIGYVTNYLALFMIFEPVEPRRVLGIRWQGLFLRGQDRAADIYSRIIADEVITLRNIGVELLHGPRADRTRQMIEDAMRPAVDRAVGRVRGAVRVAVGTEHYDAIRSSLATEAVEYTMTPMSDPEFNRQQSDRIQALIATRMRELSPTDFGEMLRSAMREDEWLLLLHGAVLGFGAGLLHLVIFG
jgi:uncharacterized membrane protein YheB (UPF0754 family)